MRPELAISRLLAAGLLLFGCDFRHEKGTGLPAASPPERRITFAWIGSHFNEPNCVPCHNPAYAAAGIDVSTYEKLIENGYVVSYSPEQSSYYTSLNRGMPPPPYHITPEEKQRVYEWIKAGAPRE